VKYLKQAENITLTPAAISALLPQVIPRWGKVQVKDGDIIRATAPASKRGDDARNCSFIRVSLFALPVPAAQLVQFIRQVWGVDDDGDQGWVPYTVYGRLEQILEVNLPANGALGKFASSKQLIVLVTPLDVPLGSDAATDIVTYRKLKATIAVDLMAVVAVIGQFASNGRRVVIDRTGGFIKPEIVQEDDQEDR
jgi:hypothetical protein